MKALSLFLLALIFSFAAMAQCDNTWLRIPAVNSWLNIGPAGVAGTALTVEACFSKDAFMNTTIYPSVDVVSKSTRPSDVNYLLRTDRAEINVGGTFFATPTVPCQADINHTYHVAMVYDGTQLSFYRNGVLLSFVVCTGAMATNMIPARIGQSYSPPSLTTLVGYINHVRIWNVVRTPAEILTNMFTPFAGLPATAGLVACYDFGSLANLQGNALLDGFQEQDAGAGPVAGGPVTFAQANPHCNAFKQCVACPEDTSIDITKCAEEPVTLTARAGVTYSWSPATGLSSTTIQSPICTATASTTYTVSITSADGCMYNDVFHVTVSGECPHCEDACNWSLTGNTNVRPWYYLGSRNDADIFFRRNNVPSGQLGGTNTAFGVGGVSPLATGGFNTSTGAHSFTSNTTGSDNVANGFDALHFNTTGSFNVSSGTGALFTNTSGSNNTALGFRSLFTNNGDNNTALGMYALAFNSTGNANTATGYKALFGNTGGSANVANGYEALLSNLSGIDNVANGVNALHSNTSGSQNSAYGTNSLLNNTIGFYNVGIGHRTLTSNVGGHRNIGMGGFALDNSISGNNNIGLGFNALYYHTTGDGNIAIGVETGQDNTTGVDNTYLGTNTGRGVTTGNSNTIIGANVTGLPAGLSNTIILSDGVGTQRLYIDNNGFAGLATIMPTAALHVNCTGIAMPNPSNVRFENLPSAEGHFLVVDRNGYVFESAAGTSDKDVAELRKEVADLQQQVKILLNEKGLKVETTIVTDKNSLEIIPTPFSNQAKAVYHIENFKNGSTLQVVNANGTVIRTYTLIQASGEIELGKLSISSSVVIFNIVVDGKNIISKRSIKVNE